LLVIVVGVLRELVVVEVLVAAVAGELLALGLRLLDHVLHELGGRVPSALRARLRRGSFALRRDLARTLVARVGDARGAQSEAESGDEDFGDTRAHGASL